ncbi:MAG: DEAD/DEAH box helicase, partial [Patescibacteria group bacterium]|nr:DEAD/DEAH box helicase [Patescibacteria group bacterium]
FNKGEIQVLLGQFETVAYGLNLQQSCHTLALFGLTWNLEHYLQFLKRVHRAGQKHAVMAHHIMAKGTIDELVWKAIQAKNRMQERLLKYLKDNYLK